MLITISNIFEQCVRKTVPSRPPFKVTQGHRNWHDGIPMISYYRSIVTMGLFCIVSKIEWNINRKLRFFFWTDVYLTPPPAEGFLLELYNNAWVQKLEWYGYQAKKKGDGIFRCFNTMHECDRRIDTGRRPLPRFAWHRAVKKHLNKLMRR